MNEIILNEFVNLCLQEPKSESALFSETKDKQLGLRESNIPEEILNDLIVSVFSKLESYIKEQESEVSY